MDDQIHFYQEKLRYEIDSWDLSESLKRGDKVLVLDARSPEAYENEHIHGARSFPHRTMTSATTAHLDKSYTYVTYCDGIGCNASTKGALQMAQLGFTVKELLGGIEWWRRDGYTTEGKNTSGKTFSSCGC